MEDNNRIEAIKPIITPQEIKEKYPIYANKLILETKSEIVNILNKSSNKFIVIVGPCSIHDYQLAIDYAIKLKALSDKISDKILVIMRVYLEKPRSSYDWKGFIYSPNLNNDFDIELGIIQTRKLLIDINNIGLANATEFIDPSIPQYIEDLISWAAIGARTSESQIHRQLSSGLSMPVGFKNSTSGNVDIALEAIKFCSNKQSFLGISQEGKISSVSTLGNQQSMLVLRGGKKNTNYNKKEIDEIVIKLKQKNIKQNIIIDCSHGNSNKDFTKQAGVLREVIKQVKNKQQAIIGVMLESNINSGNQKLINKDSLQYGVSITDQCISFEETESLLLELYQNLD